MYFSLGGRADNFHALLYRLIAKADPMHRARIRAGFPNEVKAWEMWQASKDEKVFFQRYGLESKQGKVVETPEHEYGNGNEEKDCGCDQ